MPTEALLVAGEASADLHGSRLVQAIRERFSDLRFFGVGGTQLAKTGMEITVSAERLNVVGGADWLDRIGEVYGAYRSLVKEIRRRRPAFAVLLDLPDFNLRLAKKLKRQGIPVFYYISPQVWAWRSYRVRTIRRYIDRMLVVFPFEEEFYEKHGVKAEFVGHPLLEQITARSVFRTQLEVLRAPRIALLPGSRESELRHHGELLAELGERLRSRFPFSEIKVPIASTLTPEKVRTFFPHTTTSQDSREVLAWADVAVVASGTATLETAVVGTPFCLFYRMNPSTAWAVKNLIRYRKPYGMPNLLQGRPVVREFIQEQAKVGTLYEEVSRLIIDEPYRLGVQQALQKTSELLGQPGASRRAALAIERALKTSSIPSGSLEPHPA